MREIVIDTETTGLDPLDGHHVVEIGAVELFNRSLTGQTFHRYVCPQRSPDPESTYNCATGVPMPVFEPCQEMKDQRDI